MHNTDTYPQLFLIIVEINIQT